MSRMPLNEALPPDETVLVPETVVRRICESFGFLFYAVFSLGTADVVDSRSVLLTNFVPEGLEFLDEAGWWDKFESTGESIRSGRPVLWDIEAPHSKSSPEHLKRFAELIAEYPISEALTVPLHYRTQLGGAFFIGNDLKLLSAEIELIQLAMLGVYPRLCEMNPVRDLKVTPREIECLSWTSEGNTSQEVAVILSISEHTVVRHLASATKKLAASNRGQAVARAIRLGLME